MENVATLRDIISKAGFDVRIGSLLPDLNNNLQISLSSGRSLTLEPIVREGDKLVLTDFDPCVVILNNDLSDGIPELFVGLDQKIIPPLDLSWAARLKSGHFAQYKKVADHRRHRPLVGQPLVAQLRRN